MFDRIVRTILEPSKLLRRPAGQPNPVNSEVRKQRTTERWCSGSIDRSTQSLALRAPSRKWAKCDRCGQLVILSSRRARLRERQHTGQVSAPPVATAIDRDDKTEQHVLRRRPRDRHAHGPREVDPPKRYVSRHIAVLDGLGYFVFLLMRRSSSCRQRLAVAAPAAIAHPKRDVNIRLRSFDEKSPSSSRCDSTCCSGWTGRM